MSQAISRRQVASSLTAAKEPRCSSIHKTVEPLLQIPGLVVSGIHDLSQDKAEFKVVVGDILRQAVLLYNQVINQGIRGPWSSNAA